jgi:hypothetical protein
MPSGLKAVYLEDSFLHVCTRALSGRVVPVGAGAAGTQFTGFTGTKVQILTRLLQRWRAVSLAQHSEHTRGGAVAVRGGGECNVSPGVYRGSCPSARCVRVGEKLGGGQENGRDVAFVVGL